MLSTLDDDCYHHYNCYCFTPCEIFTPVITGVKISFCGQESLNS